MDLVTDLKFTEFLRGKAEEAQKYVLKRPLTKFISMLNADGGYKTASTLIGLQQPSDGFNKLWEHRRLDLTVEAIVVETRWSVYFDQTLLNEAERKLKGAGYRFARYRSPDGNERLPASTLNKTTPEFIWAAVQQFEAGGVDHPFGPSTDYDLIPDDGRRFPPKAVFGVALSMALDGAAVEPKHFSGGETSACFRLLREAGYQVVLKDSMPSVIDYVEETAPPSRLSHRRNLCPNRPIN
ncbi:hypothetical protein [Burkholderia contaminans]|uniref:hypothetical protein n=1 Tax=Burkholderia contaminans TaxID=488447 RepID=UPI0013CEC3A6|nr:hypothetical protein [Burkholderia contaminans]